MSSLNTFAFRFVFIILSINSYSTQAMLRQGMLQTGRAIRASAIHNATRIPIALPAAPIRTVASRATMRSIGPKNAARATVVLAVPTILTTGGLALYQRKLELDRLEDIQAFHRQDWQATHTYTYDEKDLTVIAKYIYKVNGRVIDEILKSYPEAATMLIQAAIKHIEKVDSNVIKVLGEHHPEVAQLFTKAAIERFDKMTHKKIKAVMELNSQDNNEFVRLAIERIDTINPLVLLTIIQNNWKEFEKLAEANKSTSPHIYEILTQAAAQHIDKIKWRLFRDINKYNPKAAKILIQAIAKYIKNEHSWPLILKAWDIQQIINAYPEEAKEILHAMSYVGGGYFSWYCFNDQAQDKLIQVAIEGTRVDESFIQNIFRRHPELAKKIVKSVKEHIVNINSSGLIKEILKHSPKATKELTQVAKHHFYKVSPCVITEIIEQDPKTAKEFAPLAAKQFNTVDPSIVTTILKHYPEAAASFAQAARECFETVDGNKFRAIVDNSNLENATEFTHLSLSFAQKEFSKNGIYLYENSQTAGHLARYAPTEIQGAIIQFNDLSPLIRQALDYEAQANKQGRYCFYHGMEKDIHFTMQMYTGLWEINNGRKVDNFSFFRFPNKQGEFIDHITLRDKLNGNIQSSAKTSGDASESTLRTQLLQGRQSDVDIENRSRLLFTNASLFGNLHDWGECTLQYIQRNSNINNPHITIEEIFKAHGLERSYYKFKDEIEELHEMNNRIGKGRLAMVVMNKDQLSTCVYSAKPCGYPNKIKILQPGWLYGQRIYPTRNMHQILETQKYDPQKIKEKKDWQYCIVLTKDIMLNPDSGVTIIILHSGDEKEWQKYMRKHDALIEKIRRDKEEYESSQKNLSVEDPSIKARKIALLEYLANAQLSWNE